MCGIAGVIELKGSRGSTNHRLAELERMLVLIGHRGPDEAGTFIDDRVALAVARLSINDLAHGSQPMGDPKQRFWIVYNGEIYNASELRTELEQRGHRFESRCDTEVALRAWMEWGEEAPGRYEGGYAFVVYDRNRRTAFLVRDRFGKRPLFYRAQNDTVVFGSEFKVLLARTDMPLRWDTQGLAALFAKWTPFGEETPFQGVRQVPAGTILRVSEHGLSRRMYVDPLVPISAEGVDKCLGDDFAAASTRLASLLRESVSLRLRSDVDVGVLLSGGLDSSVIAHLASEHCPGGLRTFSIRFQDPQFDESREQDLVAKTLGLAHSAIDVKDSDISDNFGEAVWHTEVPQFRTAFVPMFLLARFVRDQGVKVVLSGEGADEILLGYDIFKEACLRAEWNSIDPEQRRQRLRGMYRYLPHFSEANLRFLQASFAHTLNETATPLFSHALRFANARFALRLLHDERGAIDSLLASMLSLPGLASQTIVRKAQWIEFHTLLQGYLLSSQGDRMMFAHGVEPRCPFLSPALVSFAARLPETFLLSPQGDEKHLLKHAYRAALPREITNKPKRPYRAPDVAPFRVASNPERFVPWVEDLLSEHNLRSITPIDTEAALCLVNKLRRIPHELVSPREEQAFVCLLSLAVLDQQFLRGLGVPAPSKRPPLVRHIDLTTSQSSGQRDPSL